VSAHPRVTQCCTQTCCSGSPQQCRDSPHSPNHQQIDAVARRRWGRPPTGENTRVKHHRQRRTCVVMRPQRTARPEPAAPHRPARRAPPPAAPSPTARRPPPAPSWPTASCARCAATARSSGTDLLVIKFVPVCLSVGPPACTTVGPSVCLSACLLARPSVHLSAPSVRPTHSPRLSTRPSSVIHHVCVHVRPAGRPRLRMAPPHLKLIPLRHSSSGVVLVGTTWPPGHMQNEYTLRFARSALGEAPRPFRASAEPRSAAVATSAASL
jgi:hypothetical protein